MTTFYIDPVTHDLDFSSGTLRWTQNDAELARQRVEIVLKTFRGEWFANINYGVPYLENKYNKVQILGKVRKDIFDSYIKQAILSQEADVATIEDYTSNLNKVTRELTVSCKIIKTNGGIVPFNIGVNI